MTMLWKNRTDRAGRTCRARRPFTLLELVVALGIMMGVAGIISLASMTFYKSWDSTRKHSQILREYHAIDIIMDTCVRGMIPFLWEDPENETDSSLVFDGQPDSIHLVALRRAGVRGTGAFLFLRIHVDYDHNLVAEYSPYPRFPWTESNDGTMPYTTEVIASKVNSVTFSYAANQSDSVVWLDRWDRDSYEFLPLAVQMTVEWQDGRTEQWLRRVAGVSSNSYFGLNAERGDTGL